MAPFYFRFLQLALLAACLSGPTRAQESICSTAPELQVLDRSIFSFSCSINEMIHELNCSGRGVPALPQTSDSAVPAGIEIFDFSHNRIKCLPKINNTMATCSVADCGRGCLLELRLHHNEIDFLHQEVFLNLTCLRSLDLSHNRITNQTLKRHHFFRLNHLLHLDLHGNPLHSLPDSVLVSAYLSQLQTLNLSSCQLESVGELALDDFFEMEKLDLSTNKLTRLSGRTFQGLSSLKVLDLRWNRLEVIEKDTFADLRQLQELLLDHNRLRYISELAFHRRVAFPTLRLFSNRFSDIPLYALSTLKKLQSLDMSHNPVTTLKPGRVTTAVQDLNLDFLEELTTVQDGAFSAFPRLSKLSLRFARRLTTISGQAFRGSTSNLSEVLLDHNGLTFLPQDLLPWQRLSQLTLHGNGWHCDCRLGWAAGRALGNTTIRCKAPLKLQGQALETLQPDELGCRKELVGVKAMIAMSLTSLALAIMGLVVWQRKRRMPCRCLRGTSGRYISVYTREKRVTDDPEDSSCGDGEVDDLDLGNGAGPRSEGGKVMILLKSFTNNGYKRLKMNDSESSQDLTLSSTKGE